MTLTLIATPDPYDEFDKLAELIHHIDEMPADLLTECWFCDGTGTYTSREGITTACPMCGGLGQLPAQILDGI